MRPCRVIPPITAAACLLLAAAALTVSGQDPGAAATGERVILVVSRTTLVEGYVEQESVDTIVVRTRNSDLERYAKARLHQIVRLVEPEPGQTGVVFRRNGQRQEGVIIEDSFERVVLEIDGIRTTLPRRDVDHVVLEPTFDEQFARYKEALDLRVPYQHIQLISWLLEHRRYALAREELDAVLDKWPANEEAARLITLVDAQLALDRAGGADGDDDDATTGDDAEPGGDVEDNGALLTSEDVNLIRVYEIDLDRPPKITIAPDTVRDLIAGYSASRLIPATETERRALLRADPLDVLELMFKLQAREFYPRVQVNTEPWSLNQFRRRVHNTWLLNGCATTRCHGGGDGGRFYLHRNRYKDERVRYTNLLILERLQIDPDWPLVNYEEPRDSLIIQYGLPRNAARKPHPEVRGWKPVFGRGGERMLDETIEWIESMMEPRPVYPIDYEPPGGDPREPAPMGPDTDDSRVPR